MYSCEERIYACTYIECLLRFGAATKACFVSSGDKDEPVLRLRRGLENRLPVTAVDRSNSLLHYLLSGLLNRGGGRCGDVGLGLVEPALYPFCERDLLLRCGERWEKGDERRETHDEDQREPER